MTVYAGPSPLASYSRGADPGIVVKDIWRRKLTCGGCLRLGTPGCPDTNAHPSAYGCPMLCSREIPIDIQKR